MAKKTNTQTVEKTEVTTTFDPKAFGTPEELKTKHGSWSAAIRHLSAVEGLENGQIAKVLGKRPQHVRNVLIIPVGKTSA